MFPSIPNEDLTWPVTQHAGVINQDVIVKLLRACIEFNGTKIEGKSSLINSNIVSSGILTDNIRSDSNKIDAWRDYQQILSELGLIYSTRATKQYLILTPIAIAFMDGAISYEELMTIQLLKYQYPNGHKTQMGLKFKMGLPVSMRNFSLAEVQASYGILLRPAVLIFTILAYLLKHNEASSLSVDELQTYAVRCLTNDDATLCAQFIIRSRKGEEKLLPLPKARRNMQDWIKLLAQSPLFVSRDYKQITLSDFSIHHIDECLKVIDSLLEPESFWLYSNRKDYKFDWFACYGNINLGEDWIKLNNSNSYKIHLDNERENDLNANHDIVNTTSFNLRPYNPVRHLEADLSKKIISEYDYRDSRQGYYLHDSMVDFIARRCKSKGAEIYEDKHSVDLFILYKKKEFLIEVKSITPSNFIKRLRTAIGQISQYDFLIPSNDIRRLGLAFTAEIPEESWVIPFVTTHLNMDLLTMSNDQLKIISNNSLSKVLYGI